MTPEVVIAATLGPLVMLLVQAVKSFFPNLGQKAIPLTIFLSALTASLLVEWELALQASLIQLATYTLEIAGVASGVYSWKPKKEEVNVAIPDYSDDK